MNTLYLGFGLLLTSITGVYTAYNAVINKNKDPWWFRLIEFIFALLFFIMSVFMASFIK